MQNLTRQAVRDIKATSTKPNAKWTPVNQKSYNADVNDIAYKGTYNSEKRFLSCPGRAFTFWWVASSGRLRNTLLGRDITRTGKEGKLELLDRIMS